MGAAMLCGAIGIEAVTIEQNAAYVANWLTKLRNDHRLIVVAAAQAQKAADYIRGTTFGEVAE
jgi:antirestriction protein ArdC